MSFYCFHHEEPTIDLLNYYGSGTDLTPYFEKSWYIFKSFIYTRCSTPKRVTSLRGPSPRHCTRATQPFFEEMLQRWRAVGYTVSDLTGPRFEPLTYRSRDERVTARPTGRFDISSTTTFTISQCLISLIFTTLYRTVWNALCPTVLIKCFFTKLAGY